MEEMQSVCGNQEPMMGPMSPQSSIRPRMVSSPAGTVILLWHIQSVIIQTIMMYVVVLKFSMLRLFTVVPC